MPAPKGNAYGFTKGQSGNPSGRPKGTKNKLGEAFLKAMYADFRKNGNAAIQTAREERPAEYLKIIASIIPKDLNIGGQDSNPVKVNIIVSSDPDTDGTEP